MSKDISPFSEAKPAVKVPVSQQKERPLDDLVVDPAAQRKIAKRLSRENLKIDDEAVLDFLTHSRRRRGVISRNRSMKGSERLLNQLQNLLNTNNEKVRGRPMALKIERKEKISFYIHTDLKKQLISYAERHHHYSPQDAIRTLIREAIKADGYTV